jgi:hypothetical protein
VVLEPVIQLAALLLRGLPSAFQPPPRNRGNGDRKNHDAYSRRNQYADDVRQVRIHVFFLNRGRTRSCRPFI